MNCYTVDRISMTILQQRSENNDIGMEEKDNEMPLKRINIYFCSLVSLRFQFVLRYILLKMKYFVKEEVLYNLTQSIL